MHWKKGRSLSINISKIALGGSGKVVNCQGHYSVDGHDSRTKMYTCIAALLFTLLGAVLPFFRYILEHCRNL